MPAGAIRQSRVCEIVSGMSLTAGLVCRWVGGTAFPKGGTSRRPSRSAHPDYAFSLLAKERGGGDPPKFLALRRLTAKQEGSPSPLRASARGASGASWARKLPGVHALEALLVRTDREWRSSPRLS